MISLVWKICGDELWGYRDLTDPFTAYVVRDAGYPADHRLAGWQEAWKQSGKAPELVGSYPDAQTAMDACQEEEGK
jgi:hypothetical protein